jgi:DNA-binding PadR family transcriptional regulator
MLALWPWTAYELTRQLRRSLSYCWPKAESVLYDEPKRLVRLGLATAQREPVRRRVRTAYAITDEGRRALGAWLATPPSPPRFEFETMLRLVYADQGTNEELLDAVRAAGRKGASRRGGSRSAATWRTAARSPTGCTSLRCSPASTQVDAGDRVAVLTGQAPVLGAVAGGDVVLAVGQRLQQPGHGSAVSGR